MKNRDEYCSTGTRFNFIRSSDEFHFSKEVFNKNILNWIFDELIIYRVPTKRVSNIEQLFYTGNYMTSSSQDQYGRFVQNFTADTRPQSDADFKDIFGWGINSWFFDHWEFSINFPFDLAKNKVKIMEETNPIFLGYELNDDYFFFNYNGYI